MSDIDQLDNVTGYGLMDRRVVEAVRATEESSMSFRHIVPDLGFEVKLIPYSQAARVHGKSKYSIWDYLTFSIESLIRTSMFPLRFTTLLGVIFSGISFCVSVFYLIYKLVKWDAFQLGMAPIIIAVLFGGSIQLLCVGMLGEYIGVILKKVTKRPVAIIEEKINFDDEESNSVH